jgi:hypothetical protein
MVDPILQVLYRGGGILARRIVEQYMPDASHIEQEMAIEVLQSGFRYSTARSWEAVRTNIVQGLQSVLHPRIGTQRTSTLLNGIETQINNVARENNLEVPEGGWLTLNTRENAGTLGANQRSIMEFQRRAIESRDRANEYGEIQEMEYEDELSWHQQQRDISTEIFTGTFIIQFAT